MFNLRDYMPEDAHTILSWICDEKTFRLWSADKYESYPAKSDDVNNFYSEIIPNGAKPMMFCDDGKAIGHFILRPLPDGLDKTVRIGFIIVDNSIRGKGYGRMMLKAAFEYISEHYDCDRITLGVFESNTKARQCYEAVGFRQYGEEIYHILDEEWLCFEMEYLK